MNRFLRAAIGLGSTLAALAGLASDAGAAASEARLNLVLSGAPTQVSGGGFNDVIARYNQVTLAPLGYNPLAKVQFGWEYGVELRYEMRPNFVVNAGLSQLKVLQRTEFLPALTQAVNLTSEVLTVPVHVGGDYYFQPYNQGDFRARAFVGGGVISYTYSRGTLAQVLSNADTTLIQNFGNAFRKSGTQDAPGYYVEGGVHMFFALRYSVLMAAYYRSGELGALRDERSSAPVVDDRGRPVTMDVSGVGLKLAVGIAL